MKSTFYPDLISAANLGKAVYNSINSVFTTLFWVDLMRAICIFYNN